MVPIDQTCVSTACRLQQRAKGCASQRRISWRNITARRLATSNRGVMRYLVLLCVLLSVAKNDELRSNVDRTMSRTRREAMPCVVGAGYVQCHESSACLHAAYCNNVSTLCPTRRAKVPTRVCSYVNTPCGNDWPCSGIDGDETCVPPENPFREFIYECAIPGVNYLCSNALQITEKLCNGESDTCWTWDDNGIDSDLTIPVPLSGTFRAFS